MNHWERLEAAAAGKPTDCAPISLWRHWPEEDQNEESLAHRMVHWQRQHAFDFVKFAPSATFGLEDYGAVTQWIPTRTGARTVVKPAITSAEQWPGLPKIDVRAGDYGRQNAALRIAAAELNNQAPILQTVFSPLSMARKLAGDAAFAHMRNHPQWFEEGLERITRMLIDFCREALRSGAHGIYFATQCASWEKVTAEEHARFGEPWDRRVLDAVRGEARFLALHAHGNNVMFDSVARYPVDILSWHDRGGGPAIADGARLFGGIKLCGLNENETLMRGSAQAIDTEVADAMRQAAGIRQVLAPGCACPLDVPPENLRLSVKAARAWRA